MPVMSESCCTKLCDVGLVFNVLRDTKSSDFRNVSVYLIELCNGSKQCLHVSLMCKFKNLFIKKNQWHKYLHIGCNWRQILCSGHAYNTCLKHTSKLWFCDVPRAVPYMVLVWWTGNKDIEIHLKNSCLMLNDFCLLSKLSIPKRYCAIIISAHSSYHIFRVAMHVYHVFVEENPQKCFY